jgi:hypothetical protein
MVELDPGQIKTKLASDYEALAPQTIAVLPFTDRGSANYVVDKVPLTSRNADQRADWAWTDANRMRRAITGYLATREFIEGNLIQIDAVLKQHGIDSSEKLAQVTGHTGQMAGRRRGHLWRCQQLGGLLRIIDFGLAGRRRCSNGLDTYWRGTLFRHRQSLQRKSSISLRSARIALNSGLSLLELRDVTLARAEEEDAREIILRIPRSP